MDQIMKKWVQLENWKNWSDCKQMSQIGKMDQLRGKWIKVEKWINFDDKKKNSVIVCLVSGEPFTGAPF